MTPRGRAILWTRVLLGYAAGLVIVFPSVLAFVEGGARNIRHLWRVVLLFALAVRLLWGVGRRPKP